MTPTTRDTMPAPAPDFRPGQRLFSDPHGGPVVFHGWEDDRQFARVADPATRTELPGVVHRSQLRPVP